MDEDHTILFQSLRASGCPLPASAKTLEDVTSEVLVGLTSKALGMISKGAVAVPAKLPRSVAARHRLCQRIAKEVKDLGFRGEAGYNQFMYPDARSSYRLLKWFVEAIPKEEDEVEASDDSLAGQTRARMRKSVAASLRSSWRHPVAVATTHRGGIDASYRFAKGHLTFTVPLVAADASGAATEEARSGFINSPLCLPVGHQCAAAATQPGTVTAISNSAAALRRLGRTVAAGSLLLSTCLERHELRQAKEAAARQAAGVVGAQPLTAEDRQRSKAAAIGRRQALIARAFGTRKKAAAPTGGLAPDTAKDLSGLLATIRASRGGGGVGLSAFRRAAEFGQEKDKANTELATGGGEEEAVDEEQRERDREEEIARLEERIRRAQAAAKQATDRSHSLEGNLQHTRLSLQQRRRLAKEAAGEVTLQTRAAELLKDPEAGRAKLQGSIRDMWKRLEQLAAAWEQHRRPLVERIMELSRAEEKRDQRRQELAAKEAEVRSSMATLAAAARAATEKIAQLRREVEAIPEGSPDRLHYTQLVMANVSTIRRQKQDIARVIADIHAMQAEASLVRKKLGATARVAQETMYSTAEAEKAKGRRGNQAFVDIYKLLIDLRDCFQQLVRHVEREGALRAEGRDLEVKVDQLRRRCQGRDRSRVEADLRQILEENQQLQARMGQQ